MSTANLFAVHRLIYRPISCPISRWPARIRSRLLRVSWTLLNRAACKRKKREKKLLPSKNGPRLFEQIRISIFEEISPERTIIIRSSIQRLRKKKKVSSKRLPSNNDPRRFIVAFSVEMPQFCEIHRVPEWIGLKIAGFYYWTFVAGSRITSSATSIKFWWWYSRIYFGACVALHALLACFRTHLNYSRSFNHYFSQSIIREIKIYF